MNNSIRILIWILGLPGDEAKMKKIDFLSMIEQGKVESMMANRFAVTEVFCQGVDK